MIYDINGNQLNAVYSANGENLESAYDVDGNKIFTAHDTLKVMTYNYQWCTLINSQLAMQQAIINKYAPDIIAIQEAATRNGSNVFPAVATQFLSDYPTKILSTVATNRNAMASRLPISNYQDIKFADNDDAVWDYQKCYVTLPSGRVVVWYNTHLTWRHDDATYLIKYAQAQEMLADAEAERATHPNIVITGDFNQYGVSFDDPNYIGVGKPYADAGYILTNWNDDVGFVKTYTGNTAPASLEEFTYPCDNIMVTPNIEIVRVVYDLTKLDYLDGNPIDHIPMFVELHIFD